MTSRTRPSPASASKRRGVGRKRCRERRAACVAQRRVHRRSRITKLAEPATLAREQEKSSIARAEQESVPCARSGSLGLSAAVEVEAEIFADSLRVDDEPRRPRLAYFSGRIPLIV